MYNSGLGGGSPTLIWDTGHRAPRLHGAGTHGGKCSGAHPGHQGTSPGPRHAAPPQRF